VGWIIKEATEIKPDPNMNREDCFCLNNLQKALIFTLKKQNQAITKEMLHTSNQPSSAHSPYKDVS
jgi:hypothetical protein